MERPFEDTIYSDKNGSIMVTKKNINAGMYRTLAIENDSGDEVVFEFKAISDIIEALEKARDS